MLTSACCALTLKCVWQGPIVGATSYIKSCGAAEAMQAARCGALRLPLKDNPSQSLRTPLLLTMAATASPFLPTVLAGKVALVTGGGSGIGLEIVRQLGAHRVCAFSGDPSAPPRVSEWHVALRLPSTTLLCTSVQACMAPR